MIKKLPLSDKKRKWAKNRDVVLRGTKLNHNASIRIKYNKELNKLIKKMTNEVKVKLTKLFKSENSKDYFNIEKRIVMDESISSKARILTNALAAKFTQLFSLKAKSFSEKMITSILKYSKTSLHSSLKQLSGGLSLKTGIVSKGMEEIAKASITENVSLIESIPEKYFTDVTGSVMRSITTGQGLSDLIDDLTKYKGITLRRAETIAYDQTSKAYATINKIRLEKIGVTHFEWLHSNAGQTPRPSHQKMDGMIFSFSNLIKEQEALGVKKEDQGLPGVPIWCRCTLNPVIKFED